MLDTISKSYLYEQHADDQDLLAYMQAYNAGQETLQRWFLDNPLACWTVLSGDLLEWCGNGIYGLEKTSIASAPTSALGPLNTEPLNTNPLNSFTPSTQVAYDLNDDLYQRILTWHLYRADGRHFTVRWLKRRIMRFLLGAGGLDPIAGRPGCPIGCETTLPVGVSFDPTQTPTLCTVTINTSLLSLLSPNTAPNVLQIFERAFVNGSLELPLQYVYNVVTVAPFAAIARPVSAFVEGVSSVLTAGPATVTAAGNVGPLTYAWSWLVAPTGEPVTGSDQTPVTDSGGGGVTDSTAGISIDEPTAVSTTFTATGMTEGTLRTGVAQCIVTDTGTGNHITLTVQVEIEHL